MKRKKAILAIMLAGVITGMGTTAIAMPMTAYAATSTTTESTSTTDTSSTSDTATSTTIASNSTSSTNSTSTPPAKPDGDNGSAPSGNGGTPPEKPSGDSSNSSDSSDSSTPPAMPSGEAPSGDSSSAPSGEAPDGAPGNGGGQSQAPTSYTAATEFSSDTTTTDETYDSTGTGENAVLISGGKVVLNNPTVTRTSSDSTGGDNASFYGVGASILNDGGEAYVNGGTITSDAKGGAGIFSYGDSATTYAKGVTINTTEDTSGGVHVAGGGTLYGWGLDVTTNGESSAAIRSDRGGGTMVIDGGTYTTNGTGSPAVYSTADITVNNATLTANNSEGICIEGQNTIRLFDSDLTSNMPDNDQNDTTWSVILYQSMSGDSEEGTSSYTITVSGTYSTTADFSGATSAPSWSDYEVECPSELTADALGTKTATATSAESASPAATTSTKTAAKKSVNAFKVAVIAVICAAAAALFGVLAHVRRKK